MFKSMLLFMGILFAIDHALYLLVNKILQKIVIYIFKVIAFISTVPSARMAFATDFSHISVSILISPSC